MGRIKQSRGRRDDGQPGKLHWTPLKHSCDCVIEWGWDTSAMPPPVFIEWCLAVPSSPCPWHGADTGISVPLDQELIALRTAMGKLHAKRATGSRKELGVELTRQANALKDKINADQDNSTLLAEIPAKYQRVMRARGYDPVESWLESRLTDIFLNHGRVTLTNEMIEMLPEPRK
ncbi:hypothetical protein ACFW2V_13265 [Streptomyces sp. NPDC058947]|uniref:hypothetical protein n=1 Tax=Streptomyces sp. NPDC058947 TaxID=3346675 RepID=UPI0036CA4062